MGTTATAPLRVLVVEDDPDTADILFAQLKCWGYMPWLTAYTGPAGLNAARSCHPDVVLLDIALPRMNGWDVARALRDEAGLEGTRIVALTAFGDDESRQRSRAAGINYHLTKPVEMQELHGLLDTIRQELTAAR